jgi:hypothetical protein
LLTFTALLILRSIWLSVGSLPCLQCIIARSTLQQFRFAIVWDHLISLFNFLICGDLDFCLVLTAWCTDSDSSSMVFMLCW